ncbi:MAG: 6-bladed beta-propeller [Bacteroidota bacterium]
MVKKIYMPVLVLLIVTGIVIKKDFPVRVSISNHAIQDAQVTELALLVEPREQRTRERIWKAVDFDLKRKISLEDERVFRPTTVKSDGKGDIYILDFSAPDIVRFSSSGQFSMRFGMGKGKGPGELINPTDFCIDNRGNVFVVDPVNYVITKFSGEGKVVSTFRPKSMPQRVGALPDGDVAVVSAIGTNLVAIYRNGQLVREFGHLSEQQQRYALAFDGYLTTDSEGNLYYAFTRAGLLISYSKIGSRIFFVKTIDATPLPKLSVSGVNGGVITRFADPSSFTALSVSVDKGRVYILNYKGARGSPGVPLDIYNSSDGKYICTVMTPGKFSACDVRGNMVYAINDTALFIFSSKGLPYVK